MESSDKLNELFTDGNEFTLHRLLSDFGGNDMNIDMNELVKFDPTKLLDTRCITEFVSGKKPFFSFPSCEFEITQRKKKPRYSVYIKYSFVFIVTMR
jgi:hypothetical protein